MQPFGWYRTLMRHPQYRWLAILGSIIYLVSPLDLSPDVIPVLGQIDDVVLLTLLFSAMSQIFLPSSEPAYGKDAREADPFRRPRSSDDPSVKTVDVQSTSVD
ncbi:MAG: YkvA family protein [Cyanobacteria bacterium P01_F01_bin.150]